MKQTNTSESGFEQHICDYLVREQGYELRKNEVYNNQSCLDEDLLFRFLEATQPKAVAKLKKFHKELWQRKVVALIDKKLKDSSIVRDAPMGGILQLLRKGVKDGHTNVSLKFFFDKPVSNYNYQALELYRANVFSVMRQVCFSPHNRKSLDMVVFVNGIPLITFELKNELTKQSVKDAIAQYKKDRDPNEELFRLGRLLVNFALDTELVYMCTHLKGDSSYFLPFNKGFEDGAGNPPNGGIKTDYLWKEILAKDSLTGLIQHFCQFISEEKEYLDDKSQWKSKKEKKMIFPRFHQLDVVRKLLADARVNGAGQKYLIQHSAGSGKSNSISWLAHQLTGLHDRLGKDLLFDTVIVITDRKVLDTQIRDNIQQFDHVQGVVEAITKGSQQLKEALEAGKKIIISTIHKFSVIVDVVGELPGNRFAIIIDEAHSSLSGQMARKLNETLAKLDLDEGSRAELEEEIEDLTAALKAEDIEDTELDGEDLVRMIVKSRKLLPNASYFAFTATPKNKTLELFGVPYSEDGKTKFRAFHLYSMKQAIEEKFIMDVLQNYTTYQSYYALLKKIEEDPEYDKKIAQKKLKAYVESHEHAIKKKTAVMVDHFLEQVLRKKEIGGKAKAIVVTSSRKNAVQYKIAFDAYLSSINSPYKTIVAFSGEIEGETETQLNGFPSDNIPKEFERNEYRFLIVANKFQTGFDQPLLHTMYVDKKLGGVGAVQTLSRLNRSHPLKKNTFVLDFVNSIEEIQIAFNPYFKCTVLGEATDPNKLFDLQSALDNFQIYTLEQVHEFSEKILANVPVDQLHSILNEAAAVFHSDLEEAHQLDFRAKVKSYLRLYVFLSQIVQFENPYLERLYIFLSHLQHKLLGEKAVDLAQGILDNIDMDSYRLQLEGTKNIYLEQSYDLKPIPTEMRIGVKEPELDLLSKIIQSFNDKYGKLLGGEDKVEKMYQLANNLAPDIAKNEELLTSLQYTPDNARITSDKIVAEEMLKLITTNFDFYKLFSDNEEFRKDFSGMLFDLVKRMMR